ncbi:MAG: hypothetical protein FJ115_04670 [Deltaproteobacteria bacterium]|nr:hypothetical protein [Deltaproteobacteria bacterium]
MRDKYYADNRDLIKWGVLIRLAERYNLSRIIQIAYLRPSKFGMLDIAGQQTALPPQVLTHFRNIRNISALPNEFSISVFDRVFDDRITYHAEVSQYLAQFMPELRLVFLDPDIGLEPARKADFRHVLRVEAHTIWAQLRSNEVFAFYQHQTNKAGKPWIEEKRTQLEDAINIDCYEKKRGKVLVGQSAAIAKDVVIYFAIKP